MQFNHDTRHKGLIGKGVYWKFKRVVNWKKFKNEKYKKKEDCYNCGTNGHFAKTNVTSRNKMRRTNLKVFQK
jgi:ribosomal protein S14